MNEFYAKAFKGPKITKSCQISALRGFACGLNDRPWVENTLQSSNSKLSLFSTWQIIALSGVGTVASSALLATNFRALGDDKAAVRTLVLGASVSLLDQLVRIQQQGKPSIFCSWMLFVANVLLTYWYTSKFQSQKLCETNGNTVTPRPFWVALLFGLGTDVVFQIGTLVFTLAIAQSLLLH